MLCWGGLRTESIVQTVFYMMGRTLLSSRSPCPVAITPALSVCDQGKSDFIHHKDELLGICLLWIEAFPPEERKRNAYTWDVQKVKIFTKPLPEVTYIISHCLGRQGYSVVAFKLYRQHQDADFLNHHLCYSGLSMMQISLRHSCFCKESFTYIIVNIPNKLICSQRHTLVELSPWSVIDALSVKSPHNIGRHGFSCTVNNTLEKSLLCSDLIFDFIRILMKTSS